MKGLVAHAAVSARPGPGPSKGGKPLQARLSVGHSNDPLEREADRIADQVLAAPAHATVSGVPRHIQRHTGQAAGSMHTAPAGVDRVLAGAGRPLDAALRQDMEQRFGHDFSRVRVHSGAAAEQSARDVNANAYTVGRQIVFGAGQFAPATAGGRRLLAHELTHVIQQSGAADPAAASRGMEVTQRARVQIARQPSPARDAADEIRDALAYVNPIAGVGDFPRVFRILSKLGQGSAMLAALDQLQWTDTSLIRWNIGAAGVDAERIELFCLAAIYKLAPAQIGAADITRARALAAKVTAADLAAVRDHLGVARVSQLLGAKPFVVIHRSGSAYTVPGLTDWETEYGASGSSSSLLKPGTRAADQPITGGFGGDLPLDTAFATGVETASAREIATLVKTAGSRIDPKLRAALISIAEDRHVYSALKSFLEKDKGGFVAWEKGGYYEGKKNPPTISVGTDKGELAIRKTLVHELLHYVFDKADSVLAESKDTGGADHPAIEAIETRFLIVQLIRSGQPPLHDQLESQFGRFLSGADYFPKMKQAIDQNQPADLSRLVNDADFMRTAVSSGLLPTASGLNFPGKDRYTPSNDQLRELAFIWAQNGAIVRHAMKRAAEIASRKNIPLKDVFKSSEWSAEMRTFLTAFVQGLGKDRTKGVTTLEAGL